MQIRFGGLPLLVKIAVGVCFFSFWILFEEVVVDRHGLSKFMPYYRVGDPCLWDLAAFIFMIAGLAYASRCS